MKHLLAALAARKIPLDTNEGELKSLLTRAQRFRGDTKGIESWEDTLEKILVELRTTEYATAFLKPVKKSEAWDYDRVILHPMDLQTMGRKVKSKSYLSKKAFADDLNLIWDNCLTYNSDPNHPLRRAAQYMRKKSDQILRRIPDRHERFAPSMIDRFKYSPSPSPFLSPSKPRLINGSTVTSAQIATTLKPNGVLPGATQLTNGDAIDGTMGAKGDTGATIIPSSTSTSAGAAGATNATEPQTTMIHAGVTNIPFEDRPALERSAEGMATFVGFDAAMDEFLASWNPDEQPVEEAMGITSGASDTRPRSSSMLSTGLPVLDVNTRLRQLADEDDELAVWKLVMDDATDASQLDGSSDVDGSDSGIMDATKKRKRGEDLMMLPRKRQRLERVPAPERNPLENWWFAMGSTALLANAVPPSVDSPPMPNPRYVRMQAARQARLQAGEEQDFKQEDRPRRLKGSDGPSRSLFSLMSENVRTRKRARDIAIKIADQIEDEKQGVDPEDMSPLVPVDAVASSQPRKPWARRAALASRRQMEAWDDTIGPAEAQDCMESTAMLILEHANFDSSSTAALQAFGDIGGRCIQNLGHSLKVLNETHRGKMTAEEMVLHALFSNSIGSIYELEAYIKSDIIKHGVGLSNMLQTLEDVATKREEPVDEDAILKDETEVMTGLGDLGEDIYGFRALGLDTEFGLKSLVVPRRLLRPKAKTASNDEGAAAEADRYPAPPAFAPLETKRIDDQIGILRAYYHHRVAALIPPVPLPPPPPVPVSVATPLPPLIVMKKSPTPEPILPTTQELDVPPPTPPPAPVFDPYNPSALSIVVPKAPVTPPAPPPPPKQEPPPSPKMITDILPTTVPVNAHGLPNIDTSLYPTDMMKAYVPLVEIPAVLEDDVPDPSRVRVGPLGQIMMPSAATVAKQKRQHKAAQVKAAAAAAAAISASVVPTTPNSAVTQSPVSATKPKKTTPKKPKKVEVAPPSV